MTETTDIRMAAIEDIPAIKAVAAAAFPAAYAGILAPEQTEYMMELMYSEESLRRQMLDEGHIYYIAFAEGIPAGYVSIQQQGPELFHLQKIYVLPDMQRRRIGRRLFEHAVRAIRGLHPAPCRMELNVNRHNSARRFYEKMGMRILREGDFPIGRGFFMNDYIMGLDLQ